MCDNHPEFVTHWLRALPAKFQFVNLLVQNENPRISVEIRGFVILSYTIPCACMASATFMKPAMLAPAT